MQNVITVDYSQFAGTSTITEGDSPEFRNIGASVLCPAGVRKPPVLVLPHIQCRPGLVDVSEETLTSSNTKPSTVGQRRQ